MGEVDREAQTGDSSVALYLVPPLTEDGPVARKRAAGDEYESVRRVVRFLRDEAAHDGRFSPLWTRLADWLSDRLLRGPRPPR